MKPSTGAAVRLHRNAVRHRPESLSAFKWNACPPSPEYAIMGYFCEKLANMSSPQVQSRPALREKFVALVDRRNP